MTLTTTGTEAPVSRQAKAGPAVGGTVLLVDDEPGIRQFAAIVLVRLGFKVLVACDGIEAVAIFREHQQRIDCVFCDVMMPRLDGWETMAALRQLVPDIPVILTSGGNLTLGHPDTFHKPPQAFLRKPYTTLVLYEAICQAMASRLAVAR